MASFDENIVREYFELHGFLVRQVRKYAVQARRKKEEEEIDLLVYNPTFERAGREPGFLLFSNELPYIHRAVVAIKAWHTTQHFTPRMFRSSADILRFLEKNVIKKAFQLFPEVDAEIEEEGEFRKILVLPGLPTADPQRSEAIELLRERGVDGIISFRSMLQDLIQKVEKNRNYQKSEILHILRILKNYDLLKDPQMELFNSEK